MLPKGYGQSYGRAAVKEMSGTKTERTLGDLRPRKGSSIPSSSAIDVVHEGSVLKHALHPQHTDYISCANQKHASSFSTCFPPAIAWSGSFPF
jgi:hypothetical protein